MFIKKYFLFVIFVAGLSVPLLAAEDSDVPNFTIKEFVEKMPKDKLVKFLKNKKLSTTDELLGLNKENNYHYYFSNIFAKFSADEITTSLKSVIVEKVESMNDIKEKIAILALILEKIKKEDIPYFTTNILKSHNFTNENFGHVFASIANRTDLNDEETKKLLQFYANNGVKCFEQVTNLDRPHCHTVATPLLDLIHKKKSDAALWFFKQYYSPQIIDKNLSNYLDWDQRNSSRCYVGAYIGVFDKNAKEVLIRETSNPFLPSEQRFIVLIKAALKLDKDLATKILGDSSFETYLRKEKILDHIIKKIVKLNDDKNLDKLIWTMQGFKTLLSKKQISKWKEQIISQVFSQGNSHMLASLIRNALGNKIEQWLKKGDNIRYLERIFKDENIKPRDAKKIGKQFANLPLNDEIKNNLIALTKNKTDIYFVDAIANILSLKDTSVIKFSYPLACKVISSAEKDTPKMLMKYPIIPLIYLLCENLLEQSWLLARFKTYLLSGDDKLLPKNPLEFDAEKYIAIIEHKNKLEDCYKQNNIKGFDRIEKISQMITPPYTYSIS